MHSKCLFTGPILMIGNTNFTKWPYLPGRPYCSLDPNTATGTTATATPLSDHSFHGKHSCYLRPAPRIINRFPAEINLARLVGTNCCAHIRLLARQGAASRQLYSQRTLACSTPVVLTGVLDGPHTGKLCRRLYKPTRSLGRFQALRLPSRSIMSTMVVGEEDSRYCTWP